jgi:hypothetical protein
VLAALEKIRTSFGPEQGPAKLALLRKLERTGLKSAAEVERLHEVLCFLRAYPDDARLLAQAERMLVRFERRADFRRYRNRLGDTGIAGTAIRERFFWSSVQWLARTWPAQLHLEQGEADVTRALAKALPRLLSTAEKNRIAGTRSVYAALDRLRLGRESDAACLARLIARLPGTRTQEALHDRIEPTYELIPGPGTPSRTAAWYAHAPRAFQTRPLRRGALDVAPELRRAPRRVRKVSRLEGERLLALARAAMVTRQRDLDAFGWGDPRAVRLAEDADSLAFMVNGMLPERRRPGVEVYGVLIFKNRVPIGYFDVELANGEAALSFNVFASFRGAETSWTFARTLAMLRHVLGARSFTLAPYQLGQDNEEAIASGAWWFYYWMGFRPRAAAARAIERAERAKMAKNRAHLSSRATLTRLAKHPMYLK